MIMLCLFKVGKGTVFIYSDGNLMLAVGATPRVKGGKGLQKVVRNDKGL